jgi:hypothetical protein
MYIRFYFLPVPLSPPRTQAKERLGLRAETEEQEEAGRAQTLAAQVSPSGSGSDDASDGGSSEWTTDASADGTEEPSAGSVFEEGDASLAGSAAGIGGRGSG